MNEQTCLDTNVPTEDVLDYFNTLDEADLDNVEPTLIPTQPDTPLRPDLPKKPLEREQVLNGETEANKVIGPKPR